MSDYADLVHYMHIMLLMYELFSDTTPAADILTSFYKNQFQQQSIFNWKFDKSKNLLILNYSEYHAFQKIIFLNFGPTNLQRQ